MNNKLTTLFVMPEELGPTPENTDPYERTNLWLLYTALSMGAEKVRFICLWDGKGGDGPGGTKHMHDEVKSTQPARFTCSTRTYFSGRISHDHRQRELRHQARRECSLSTAEAFEA